METTIKKATICVKCAHCIPADVTKGEDMTEDAKCRVWPYVNYVEGIDKGYLLCRHLNTIGECSRYTPAENTCGDCASYDSDRNICMDGDGLNSCERGTAPACERFKVAADPTAAQAQGDGEGVEYEICPTCSETPGRVHDDNDPRKAYVNCPDCGGTGMVPCKADGEGVTG